MRENVGERVLGVLVNVVGRQKRALLAEGLTWTQTKMEESLR